MDEGQITAICDFYSREELIIEIKKMLSREAEGIRQAKAYGGFAQVRLHNHGIVLLNGILRRLEYGKRN